VYNHLKMMDFSTMPGWISYYAYRTGLIGFWRRHIIKRMPRPEPPKHGSSRNVIPVIATDAANP
jgi:hypothetical protein